MITNISLLYVSERIIYIVLFNQVQHYHINICWERNSYKLKSKFDTNLKFHMYFAIHVLNIFLILRYSFNRYIGIVDQQGSKFIVLYKSKYV